MPRRAPSHKPITPEQIPGASRHASRTAEDALAAAMGIPAGQRPGDIRAREAEVARALDRERGTAHARGYGAKWRKLRAWFLRRHPLCAACRAGGVLRPATVVDHILPRRRGGTDALRNLQPLCERCHNAKTAREMDRRPVAQAQEGR